MEDLKEQAAAFFIISKSEDTTFEFSQNDATVAWFWPCIEMEAQKIRKLLGDADSESLKFLTRKWYAISDQIMPSKGKEIKAV